MPRLDDDFTADIPPDERLRPENPSPPPTVGVPGHVVLYAVNIPDLQVIARLGNGPLNPSPSGFGGWREIERPQNRPLTYWGGHGAVRCTVPLVLDGYDFGTAVDDSIRVLRQMASMRPDGRHPPTIRTTAPVPFAGGTWVIESLELGAQIRNPLNDSQILRQQVSVGLMEFIDPERAPRITVRLDAQGQPRPRSYKVRKGENGYRIARRFAVTWQQIRALNPKQRDPMSLKAGTVLRLP